MPRIPPMWLTAQPSPKKSRARREQSLQQQVVAWWDGPGGPVKDAAMLAGYMANVPIGGDHGKRLGGIMKSMGVRKGWPDLQVVTCCPLTGAQHSAFFELKTAKTKPSDEQEALHVSLTLLGFPVFVIRSLEEFIGAIDALGIPHRTRHQGPGPSLSPRGLSAPPAPQVALAAEPDALPPASGSAAPIPEEAV